MMNTAIDTVTIWLPSFYAPFLFYGNAEGIDERELAQLYNVLANHLDGIDLNGVTPLDFVETGYAKWHAGSWAGMPSGDCGDYTFPV